jgi:transposase
MSWAQVWDILAVTLEKVHYLLPRRRCGCGRTTTAAPPFGAAGSVVYGPRINAAAILLASEGNVPIERTARLMGGTAEGCRCRAVRGPGAGTPGPAPDRSRVR